MGSVRAFFQDHCRLAVLLVIIALSIKAIVPSGYMIGSHSGRLSVQICDGQSSSIERQIVFPSKDGEHQGQSGKSDGHCPYTVLALASLAGVDAILLAVALLFLLVLGFEPIRPPQRNLILHLRPPVRGPPEPSR